MDLKFGDFQDFEFEVLRQTVILFHCFTSHCHFDAMARSFMIGFFQLNSAWIIEEKWRDGCELPDNRYVKFPDLWISRENW
jgi:hypothetical protein